MARRHQFTVYDMMEARGAFDSNPANPHSRGEDNQPLYVGPVPFPKMFYHPLGEERITNPGEVIETLRGPKTVGEMREMIFRLAHDAEEEAELRAEGWHDHPAKALAAAGKDAPEISPAQKIDDLEAKLAALQAQLAKANEAKASAPVGKKSVRNELVSEA